MGRYDGEDYEDRGYCAPGTHKVAPNGTCWICHHMIWPPPRNRPSAMKPKAKKANRNAR